MKLTIAKKSNEVAAKMTHKNKIKLILNSLYISVFLSCNNMSEKQHQHTNALINESSPYLLQHAHNPVNWFPWGDEALKKAKDENKPLLISIGYSACHWCHVMEKESFENTEVAALMNANFVCVKVDREERPDVDAIYMTAVQLMNGQGGWPLNCFALPDGKPFYGGTYFPKEQWKKVLQNIDSVYKNDFNKVLEYAERLSAGIRESELIEPNTDAAAFQPSHLDSMIENWKKRFDNEEGGPDKAPKFPLPNNYQFLLRYAHLKKDKELLNHVNLTLKKMACGGIYDQVGGGFARYSTDKIWKVPHFEKMLYDNALLVRAYLHAWQVTKNPFYKRIVQETLDFVAREMTHPDGGFYSSLDADSEGEEGKFYVLSQAEIKNILKDDYDFFEAAYGITAQGNWEGKTVLQRVLDDSSLAARFKLDTSTRLSTSVETVTAKLAESHSKLLSVRDLRIRPGTDDKVLTAWNGLMLAAVAEVARVFSLESNTKINDSKYYRLATRNTEFLLSKLRPDGKLVRAWRDGKTTNEVFLEDYAALILGLLELYQTDFDNKWFTAAKELTDEMIEKFSDENGGFFDTPNDGENLLIRPKDIQDNATPSGNSLACEALVKMAEYTGEGKYRDLAEKSLSLITSFTLRYPLGFARWLSSVENVTGNMKQVALMGEADEKQIEAMKKVIQAEYRPNIIVACSSYPIKENSPALLNDRIMIQNQATAYVCEGFVCKQPTTEIEKLVEQLKS